MSKITFFLCLMLASVTSVAQQKGKVDNPNEGAIQPGRFAYIAPHEATLYEVNLKGEVTWSFKLPGNPQRDLSFGADVEWIRETDSFLYVVPTKGIFEVSRAGKIIWSHETKFVSHDADRLPNGNTVFVYGWGGDDDPSFTEVDRSGKTVQSWKPGGELSKTTELWLTSKGEEYSYTHANAVQRLDDGSTLVSLRNFHQFVIIKDGKIQKQYRLKPDVHDPVMLPDGTLYYAILAGKEFHEATMEKVQIPYGVGHFLVKMTVEGKEETVIKVGQPLMPLHTVQPLPNGNFLLTGSTAMAQVSPEGKVVWRLTMDGFKPKQADGRRWLYKATWVDKQD
jgi:hypothetical protein